MTRRVRFSKYEPNKSLYDYNRIGQASDDNCWLVFLSDRDLHIIYEALQWANKQQTRVFTAIDDTGEIYTIADGAQWENFKWWVSQLYDHLGARQVTNELLERIANNLQMDVVVDNQGTIETRSITQVIAGGAGGADFDELIDAISEQGQGIEDYGLKDWLEMMTYTKDLLPNFNGPSLFGIIKAIMEMRFKSKLLGQLAMINTNLRYAGLALSPPRTNQTPEDEEAWIQQVFQDIDLIPWLTSGVAALAEPTPAGETALSVAMSKVVGQAVLAKLKQLWDWWNSNPTGVPEGSIVGMLEQIANAAGGGSNSQSVTLQQIINNISTAPGDDDIVDFPHLYGLLTQIMDFLPDDQGDYKLPDPSTLIQTMILDRTLSEMSDRINELELSVTNNFNPSNPITNNFSPTNNFNPTNNVNFDIASIVTELGHIKDNLLNISGDTDALAHLDRLNDITTNLGEINNRINELQCICDNLAQIAFSMNQTDTVALTGQYNNAGIYRCEAGKWYLGKMFEAFSILKEESESWGNVVFSNIWNFYVTLYSEVSKKLGEILGFIDPRLEEFVLGTSIQETLNIHQTIIDLRLQWLDDIYNATSPDDAITAMATTLDAYSPGGFTVSQAMKDAIGAFWERSRGLERVFLPEGDSLIVTQEEMDIYSVWNPDSCDADLSCMPQQMYWSYGTPSIESGGIWDLSTYPVGTWVTITSEWDSEAVADARKQQIYCPAFDDDYDIEFEILSVPSGLQILFWLQDCAFDFITQQYHSSPVNIGTYKTNSMAFQSWPYGPTNPGTFQVRIRRTS